MPESKPAKRVWTTEEDLFVHMLGDYADDIADALECTETEARERIAYLKKHDVTAVALGRKGGLKGGPARAMALTPEQRREIGRQAAQIRWGKRLTPPGGSDAQAG